MTPVNRRGILWFFLICGVISLIIWSRSQNFGTFSWIKPFEVSYLIPKSNKDTLQLKNLVKNLQGSYAILVYHLDDQTWYGINEDMVMPAASIMKVPIMAAALDIPNIEFTDKELIIEMGQKSDNAATNIIAQKVGDEAVIKILSDWDMTKTNYEQNTITASDTVKMWKRVYKKPEMWDYLQDSIYEDRITLGLPAGTRLVHKVGTDEGVWSDSGIVFAPKPYILVILTRDSDRDEAKKIVPEITKIIWDHEVKSEASQSPSPVQPELQLK